MLDICVVVVLVVVVVLTMSECSSKRLLHAVLLALTGGQKRERSENRERERRERVRATQVAARLR